MVVRKPYESGQVRVIFPYIHPGIKQFILGGPADGDEAQILHREFPKIHIAGFEPNIAFYQYQMGVGFPGDLYKKALWDNVCEIPFTPCTETNAETLDEESCRKIRGSRFAESSSNRVSAISLDSMFFPAKEKSIALWIDIERSELKCLKGAQGLLETGGISVIMLEAMGDTIIDLQAYLTTYKYREVHAFNGHDHIFCQKEDSHGSKSN